MHPFRSLLVLLLLSSIVLLIRSPSSREVGDRQATSATLRLAIAADPIHLDPLLAGDSISGLVLRMIYEGLTRLDEHSSPQPALAHSWRVSSDGQEYTFYLRRAYWSNGIALTAHDFVTAWRRMLDPSLSTPNAYLLYPIAGARQVRAAEVPSSELGVWAEDDSTLKVRLEEPAPYFLQLLAFDAFFPVCSSLVEKGGVSNKLPSLSCGPFILTDWKPKDELLFQANPHYWDRQHVQMQRIQVQVIGDTQTALYLFEQGRIDWIGAPLSPIPLEALEALSHTGKLITGIPASTYWIHCQLQHPLLADPRARCALSLSIDRAKLAKALGVGHTPADSLIPPALKEAEWPPHPNLQFNPKLARTLWNQALETGSLDRPLLYLYNSSGMNNLHAKVAQLLQAQWREHLGLKIELQGIEWALFLERARRGEFDLARFGWTAQFSDPTSFLDIFEMREGAYNFSRYQQEPFKRLIEQIHYRRAAPRSRAVELAQERLLDELPVIPLFFSSHTYMKHPDLQGVVIGPLGRIDFKRAYWEMKDERYSFGLP